MLSILKMITNESEIPHTAALHSELQCGVFIGAGDGAWLPPRHPHLLQREECYW